jgi:hypothetical protein
MVRRGCLTGALLYVYVAMNTDRKLELLDVAVDPDQMWVTSSGQQTLARIDR